MEELAYYLSGVWSETERGFAFGLLILGGLLAMITWRSDLTLLRAPYFAYTGCVSLFIAVCSLGWLNIYSAMANQYLWLLMLITISAYFVGGYVIGILAKARSRDINGKSRLALLAFVPLLNLILLLSPSREPLSLNRLNAPKIFSGYLGVFVALLITVTAGAVSAVGAHLVGQITKAHESQPLVDQVAFLIRARGLERSLELMSKEATLPAKVDDETSLISIVPEQKKLVRTFAVSKQSNLPLNSFRILVRKNVCADPILALVLASGASLVERYVLKNGDEIASVTVDNSDCMK